MMMNTLIIKTSLIGLFVVCSEGTACSSTPSALVIKANKTLQANGKEVVCATAAAPHIQLTCMEYKSVPGRHLARLLAQSLGVEPQKENGKWKVIEPEAGRITIITPAEQGSITRTEDVESTRERVASILNNHPTVKAFKGWKNCKEAKLSQLKIGKQNLDIQNCTIITKKIEGTVLQFKVIQEIDASLPEGIYEWKPKNKENCSGVVKQVVKKNKKPTS